MYGLVLSFTLNEWLQAAATAALQQPGETGGISDMYIA